MFLLVLASVNAVSLGYWNGNLVYNTSFEETGIPANWSIDSGTPDWDDTSQAFDGSESLLYSTVNNIIFPEPAFDKEVRRNYSIAVYCTSAISAGSYVLLPTNNIRARLKDDGNMDVIANPTFFDLTPDESYPIGEWFIIQLDMNKTVVNMYFINSTTGDVISSSGDKTTTDTDTNNRYMQGGGANCFYDLFQSGNGTYQPLVGGVADTTPPNVTLINLTSECLVDGCLAQIIYNQSTEELGLLTGLAKTAKIGRDGSRLDNCFCLAGHDGG